MLLVEAREDAPKFDIGCSDVFQTLVEIAVIVIHDPFIMLTV